MTLITRVTRLFKADMHAVLDAIEEPLAILKQAVREMQEEIGTNKKLLEDKTKQQGLQRAQLDCEQQNQIKLNTQLDLCFQEENKELAMTILRKKLESVRRSQTIAQTISQLTKEIERLSNTLREQKEQLQSIIEKVETYRESRGTGNDYSKLFDLHSSNVSPITEEELELAFLEEKRNRSQNAA